MSDSDTLRTRLLALRASTLKQLEKDETPDTGFLLLLANTAAALDALDYMPADAEAAERAVVADDGQALRLTLYGREGAVAMVSLTPLRALSIAGQLLAAALARLR